VGCDYWRMVGSVEALIACAEAAGQRYEFTPSEL